MNTLTTNLITVETLSTIADEFTFERENDRKSAIDKMNNAIYDDTTIDELRLIALGFSSVTDEEERLWIENNEYEMQQEFNESGANIQLF